VGLRMPAASIEELLEALPDGVAAVDSDGRIVYASSHLERLSGYRSEELVGQLVELLVPARLHTYHTARRTEYAAKPYARPMSVNPDILLRRKDGTEYPADIALSPLQTASGAVVVAALRDATERKRVEARLHRLAVLEDRERIAKELHDGVIQSLFGVGMNLRATDAKVKDLETMRAHLIDAVDGIDMAIRDLRNYVFGLRPGVLTDRQLDQALRKLAEEFHENTGIVTAVDVDARVAVEIRDSSAQLVQITREALSNVARHAGAQTCRVSLRRQGDFGVLEVEDDGHGFDPAQSGVGGQGLRNMRARVGTIGGKLSIKSASAEGTRIRVTLPL
jgi:PAS domain S-box-containing protein